MEDAGLDEFSTAWDGRLDVGTEDIGYHYPGPKGISDVTVTNHRFDPNASGSAGYCQFTVDFWTSPQSYTIAIVGPGYSEPKWKTGDGDINETWDEGQQDGVYTVTITSDTAGTVKFIMIIDTADPTVAVTWPDNNQRMMGL